MISRHRGKRYRLTERGKTVLLTVALIVIIAAIYATTGELDLR